MRLINVLLMAILFVLSCGEPEKKETKKATVPKAAKKPEGYATYKQHCVVCHGMKGDLGVNGSGDLTASKLTLEETVEIITNGRNTMMPYKTILKKDEIESVAKYLQTLKK